MENRRPSSTRTFGQKRFSDVRHNGDARRSAPFKKRDRAFAGNGNDRSNGNHAGNSTNGNVAPKVSRSYKRSSANDPERYAKFPPKRQFAGRPVRASRPQDKIKITSDLQITDGKHRGRTLQNLPSPNMNPSPRRIREIMFKILSRRIRARRFLDLCCGPGTLGFEAISRGAMLSTFVDRSARMCSYVRKNMEQFRVKDGHGEVLEMEIVPFLKNVAKRKRTWDFIYLDPPFDSNYDELLKFFSRGVGTKTGSILLLEHHSEMFFPEMIGPLKRFRVITHGDTALSFYERK